MEYTAVIGANYGDEGKGRLVNYLSDPRTAVIRYSGSAQAAHTVVHEGKRHVFKHFGSGTLRGATTFLSNGFLCHPIMFMEEREKLLSLDADNEEMTLDPDLDADSIVVLPTDMIINQAQEVRRSGERHGSCGMGVRQAIERSTVEPLLIRAGELEEMCETGMIHKIMRRHLEVWCAMNGTSVEMITSLAGIKDLSRVLNKFEETVRQFCRNVNICDDFDAVDAALDWAGRWIFEGSQGLALDPGCGPLPHLTPTHVGVGGLVGFDREYRETFIPDLELMYATRPYLSRHGAGPLPGEGEWPLTVHDETNQPNDWQGTLRFAPLDFRWMHKRICDDLQWMELFREKPKLRFSLGVTCVDQVENTDFPFVSLAGDTRHGLSDFLNECGHLMEILANLGEMGRLVTCYGPETSDTHDSGVGQLVQAA